MYLKRSMEKRMALISRANQAVVARAEARHTGVATGTETESAIGTGIVRRITIEIGIVAKRDVGTENETASIHAGTAQSRLDSPLTTSDPIAHHDQATKTVKENASETETTHTSSPEITPHLPQQLPPA
jgi:hypothetical protein